MDMETMEAIPTSTALAKTAAAKAAGGAAGAGEAGVEGEALAGKTITPAVTADPNAALPTPVSTATATPIPAPTSTPAPISTYEVPSSYTIHKGEYPYCLSRRFNINPDDLLAYNGLYRGVILYPGNTLQIPSNARPFPGQRTLRSHPASYTVQASDTFYTIACLFGDVDPRAIATRNGMDVSQGLSTGATIHIP